MSSGNLNIELEGQELTLDPDKALFWREASFLLLSDLHLGKVGHFRKHGIAVPVNLHHNDLMRLDLLITRYNPRSICFLGDLFHSEFNAEWNQFLSWMENYPEISMILVQGNHDILAKEVYSDSNLVVYEELVKGPFHFTHQKSASVYYNISGHVHPSIRLKGMAKQGVTVPCFYFSRGFGLLPAFGGFTGTYKIRPFEGDRVFVTSGEEVIALMG